MKKLSQIFTEKGIPFSEINSIKSLFENDTIKEVHDKLVGKVESKNYNK